MFNTNQLYDKETVCQRLSISLSLLNKLIRSDALPFIKIGRAVRFKGEVLNEFIEQSCV